MKALCNVSVYFVLFTLITGCFDVAEMEDRIEQKLDKKVNETKDEITEAIDDRLDEFLLFGNIVVQKLDDIGVKYTEPDAAENTEKNEGECTQDCDEQYYVPEFNEVEKQKECVIEITPFAPVEVTGMAGQAYLFWTPDTDGDGIPEDPYVLKDLLIHDPILVDVRPGFEIEVKNLSPHQGDPHFGFEVFVLAGHCQVSDLSGPYDPVKGWKPYNYGIQTYNYIVTP